MTLDPATIVTRCYAPNAEVKLVRDDHYLKPHQAFFSYLQKRIADTRILLTHGDSSIFEAASGHHYFGFHRQGNERILREWAPNATTAYLIGSFSEWKTLPEFALSKDHHGVWCGSLPLSVVPHGTHYRLYFEWDGGHGERVPAWAQYVVQDPNTLIFSAQVWDPPVPFVRMHPSPTRPLDNSSADRALLIYEAHIGMAQEEARIGSYREFTERVLPHIHDCGYNAVQLMGILEHPYYGSFGYQVSSFFAPSSRFGTPDDLKHLIDTAHGLGIHVFLDLVHSHAVKNENEGISRFDGSLSQFFHAGSLGEHPLWDSRLFNYGKLEVLHFLLSNVRYWLEEFHFDGFRFDGITSMLFHDHGLGKAFTSYNDYFSANTNVEALTYLALANEVAHAAGAHVQTIAEDMSGMPGLAAPIASGGFGFDFRLSMGTPDLWIRLCKDSPDEAWNVEEIFYELTNRRKDEATIGYAESHDQALVGDQTLLFRLLERLVYTNMRLDQRTPYVDRGLCLHRVIRLLTATLSGSGYLNFMGNEFGHPEWIDFPRIGNNWSYAYARRQWSLAHNKELQYHYLGEFDKALIDLIRCYSLFQHQSVEHIFSHVADKVLAYRRGSLYFVVSLNPDTHFERYEIPLASETFNVLLDTDDKAFAGLERHGGRSIEGPLFNLPPRSGLVLTLTA